MTKTPGRIYFYVFSIKTYSLTHSDMLDLDRYRRSVFFGDGHGGPTANVMCCVLLTYDTRA